MTPASRNRTVALGLLAAALFAVLGFLVTQDRAPLDSFDVGGKQLEDWADDSSLFIDFLRVVEVARRMGATCRAGDELGRIGGDEFVMLCWTIRRARGHRGRRPVAGHPGPADRASARSGTGVGDGRRQHRCGAVRRR